MDIPTTSEQEEFMDAVRNENIDVVTSYVKKGIFQRLPKRAPLIYSCLPLANSKEMLNILIAASPLVVDDRFQKFINENVIKPFILEFLLDYLKSQNGSLDKNGVDLMSSAITKRAPVESYNILLDHGVDPCETPRYESSSLQKVAAIDEPWSINIIKLFCVSSTGSITFRTQLESVIRIVMSTLVESTSINDLKFEKLKILFTAGMSDPYKNWYCREEAILVNVFNFPCLPRFKIRLMRLFFESGEGDVNSCDRYGRTLIMLAVINNEEVMIDLLFKSCADLSLLDSSQRTVLHYAMLHRPSYFNHSLIYKLLQHGSDPNVSDCVGKTPLILALEKFADYNIAETRGDVQNAQHQSNVDVSSEVIKSLLKHGANPNLVDPINGTSPLMVAVVLRVKIEIIDILVRSGANLQHQDKEGNSLLHHAVQGYNKQYTLLIVQNLLNHGIINLNVVNAKGETPLMLAAKNWRFDIETVIKLLINAGSDLRITDLKGNTAFHFLARNYKIVSEWILNIVFETYEDYLCLNNAKNESVFYLLAKKCVLKRKKNLLDYFVNLCKTCSEENLFEMSKDVQNIFCETFRSGYIEDLQSSNLNYFMILLSSPFKIANNHVMRESLPANDLSKMLISTNVAHCNFITKMCVNMFTNWMSYCEDIFNNILAFIKKLESYGFDLLPSNTVCISPLTFILSAWQCFILHPNLPLSQNPHFFLNIAQYLIEKGVDVTESKLEFKDVILTDLHRQFPVPDALLIALLSGPHTARTEFVRLLLPFWPHPPLSLLIYILPVITRPHHYEEYLLPVYPILAAGGPLPIGSPIYQRVSQLLEQKQNVVGKIRLHFQSMHHNDGEIRSLLSLSVSATRATFPGGSDLPERLSKPMPPGIKNILQLDLDTTLVQEQLDDIEEPHELLQESSDDDSSDDGDISFHDHAMSIFYDSDTGSIYDFLN